MKTVFVVGDSIHINAPVERVFLLSTSIDLVGRTLGMTPVKGRTRGMIVEGDRILWKGWKFGLPQVHETLITGYVKSKFFQDTMGTQGRFATFQHDHHFVEVDGHTLLNDKVRFSLPLGWPGKMVAHYVMVPHIAKLLKQRFELLKRVAEGQDWERYIGAGDSAGG